MVINFAGNLSAPNAVKVTFFNPPNYIAPLDETIEGLEQFALFCKAVQKLPLQCRRVFILRKVYGLTHKEIAEHLDISVSTIEKHLATGISRCSDYMRSKGYGFKVKMPGKVTQPGRKT